METFLSFLCTKYYQPQVGRFTQEDLLFADGLNLYAYCANNPVMYSDPSGLAKKVECNTKDQAENGITESNNSATVIDYSRRFNDGLENDFNTGAKVRGIVQDDMILVQFSSDAPNASLRYWTTIDETNKISTLDEYMDKMALSKEWGNRNVVKVARVRKGTKVIHAVGTAKAQLDIIDPRPGNGQQILFSKFDLKWITDIRNFPE